MRNHLSAAIGKTGARTRAEAVRRRRRAGLALSYRRDAGVGARAWDDRRRADDPGAAAAADRPSLPSTSPVVLAPMAGITNRGFRRLCREYGAGPRTSRDGASGAGARLVRQRDDHLARAGRAHARDDALIQHDPQENPRSRPALRRRPGHRRPPPSDAVDEDRADHIDLNFGCPVPKVTRKGGGAALPWKTGLFRAIVARRRAGGRADDVPVTVKMRIGIDADHVTYLDAGPDRRGRGRRRGRAARAHRRPALLRHGRLGGDRAAEGGRRLDPGARQRRHLVGRRRPARWSRRPAATASWSAAAASGRPWLFADLAAAFAGSPARVRPTLRRGGARRCAGTPCYLVEFYDGERQGLPRLPQARRLVPQGLPGRVDGPPPARAGRLAGRARRPDRHPGPRASRGPASRPRASAAGPGRRARSPCRRAGWTARS